jgi:hypothetical protein
LAQIHVLTNLKQELPVAAMFANESGGNEQSLYRNFYRCFLPSFGSFGKVVSEEKIFRNRPIRNKNCLWRPSLLTNRKTWWEAPMEGSVLSFLKAK